MPALSVRALACKTNTVSNTAFRGFGGPQGLLLMEDVVHRVARSLGLPPEEVRAAQFRRRRERCSTPYGQELEGDLIRRVWAEVKADSGWDAKRREIAAFNAQHPYLRRGLGSMVLAFGISFGQMHMNQAGALVHVYADGSIRLNHGGTEMGQGLFIKIAQVVASVFGVDVDRIGITATSTAEVPEHLAHRRQHRQRPERLGGACRGGRSAAAWPRSRRRNGACAGRRRIRRGPRHRRRQPCHGIRRAGQALLP